MAAPIFIDLSAEVQQEVAAAREAAQVAFANLLQSLTAAPASVPVGPVDPRRWALRS